MTITPSAGYASHIGFKKTIQWIWTEIFHPVHNPFKYMEAIVMSSEKNELKSKAKDVSGLVFVGCLMLGLAAGFLMGNIMVGVLGGLGVGFILIGIAMVSEESKGSSGVVFVGCLMLGFAIGFLVGNIVVGLFGGLGVGFIGMYLAHLKTGEW